MIQVRDLNLAPYDFQLQFFTDKAMGADINRDNCEGIIEIIYQPQPSASTVEVDKVFKEKEPDIIRLISAVLDMNKKFYSQFNVPLEFYRTEYQFKDDQAMTGKVIKASTFLKITMKDNKN